ncbi:hypothetical protein [Methanolapillus millepedarum]|uniref:Uncharacterized protein n=1 Tax=Methanolapillus millepedarum TaxID=3028296 RepID=A0AA96ZV83_9EURY|nr:hypothetical protein MsAc7_00840 [Methanosarcinaceae archaeon Ac7]
MPKVLSLQDLINRKYHEMMLEEGVDEELEDLYDLVVPMGAPMSIIMDMVEIFELEVTERVITIHEPEVAQTTVIALRGPLDRVTEAEEFMRREIRAWIEQG